MRKFISLLGVLVMSSMYVTAAMALPLGPFVVGGSGESDLSASATDPTAPLIARTNVDWFVLDLSTATTGSATVAPSCPGCSDLNPVNGATFRANWEALVTDPAYVSAFDVNALAFLTKPASFAPYPTLYAYLYQAENTLTDLGSSMTLLSILFAGTASDIVAAGALMTTGLQAVPLTGPGPGVPPAFCPGLAGTLNRRDNFGNCIDDLDLASNYHPIPPGPNSANNAPPGTPGAPDPAVAGPDVPPQSGLDEEGPKATDLACPGGAGDNFGPTEFCEASGLFGIFTTVVTGNIEFNLTVKPSLHETPTLYILSTRPPVPGVARMQGVHQLSSENTQRALLGDKVPVPSAIPEPGTFLLMGTGLACLLAQGLRRKLKA